MGNSMTKTTGDMIGNIEIPKVHNVHIAAIKEWNEDFTAHEWNIYVINNREDEIKTVLVMSRGQSDDRKTSTLRHFLEDITPGKSEKVEMITEEVFSFTNEYLLTFFAEGKLFERRFVFDPYSIAEKNIGKLPAIEEEGVLAQ